MLCGIDEAGRGPLAGPVTAAAVILPSRFDVSILKDSKKLLIHLDTLEDVGLAESQVIIEALRDESSKEIEDILFSLRIDTHLKNRIECSFIAGKFRVE